MNIYDISLFLLLILYHISKEVTIFYRYSFASVTQYCISSEPLDNYIVLCYHNYICVYISVIYYILLFFNNTVRYFKHLCLITILIRAIKIDFTGQLANPEWNGYCNSFTIK